MIKVFTECRCKVPSCGLIFQPVDWLPWRVAGFCSEKCQGQSSAESAWVALAMREEREAARSRQRAAEHAQGSLL
ncbi:MAG: hypothetical protein JSR38_12770 [Proteobacteria bacterium]|nr:hypothetical protein [Pseudomonadota bacterium]